MAKIAFLLADMYEDSEFRVPYERLKEAGHDVVVAGHGAGMTVEGKEGDDKMQIDVSTIDLDHEDFDALVIPGGYSPDKIRTDEPAVTFTRAMFASGKTVAAICHGPWVLAEADVITGLELTSWPSIQTDLENAGARWVNQAVVEDANLITSRKPSDIDAFCEAIIGRLRQHAAA